MKWLIFGLMVGLLYVPAGISAAEEPGMQGESKQAEKIQIPADETPEQAMVRGAHVIDQLDVDKAMELYECANDQEKMFVREYCKYAVEITKAEHAVKKQFGEKKSDEMLHAIGEFAESDLPHATYKTDGDTASVQYPGQMEPGLHLRRINGVWKIDIHVELKAMSDDELKQETKRNEMVADKLGPVVKKIEEGEYKTVEDVNDALEPIVNLP